MQDCPYRHFLLLVWGGGGKGRVGTMSNRGLRSMCLVYIEFSTLNSKITFSSMLLYLFHFYIVMVLLAFS